MEDIKCFLYIDNQELQDKFVAKRKIFEIVSELKKDYYTITGSSVILDSVLTRLGVDEDDLVY